MPAMKKKPRAHLTKTAAIPAGGVSHRSNTLTQPRPGRRRRNHRNAIVSTHLPAIATSFSTHLPSSSPHRPFFPAPKAQPIPAWAIAPPRPQQHHPLVPKGQPTPASGIAPPRPRQHHPLVPNGTKCDSLGHRPRTSPTNHPAACRAATYRTPKCPRPVGTTGK